MVLSYIDMNQPGLFFKQTYLYLSNLEVPKQNCLISPKAKFDLNLPRWC